MSGATLPKYGPGDRVRVSSEEPEGHCRTPRYVQGRQGTVRKLHGSFRNPESLAYGGTGLPRQPLYLVEFGQPELWKDYKGAAGDRLWIDLYQHWLEPLNDRRISQ
jgi:nitrile hydratase